MLAGSFGHRYRDPHDVPIQVSDHKITMPPRAVTRRLDNLDAHPPNLLEEIVEFTVDPELRLDGTRHPMGGVILSQEVNRNAVTVEDCVHGHVARRIHDPRLEAEHAAVPLYGRADVCHGVNRIRLLPFHDVFSSG